MTLQIFAIDGLVLGQPLTHQRAGDAIGVDPSFIARVVRRVDVDALDASGVAGEKCLQSVEIVAVDDEVAVGYSCFNRLYPPPLLILF